jgi:hypothetical protein
MTGEPIKIKHVADVLFTNIQGDSRVIMSLTKFVMQPTIHVFHILLCVFIDSA